MVAACVDASVSSLQASAAQYAPMSAFGQHPGSVLGPGEMSHRGSRFTAELCAAC
jgi:hypothetical protein